MTWWGLLLIIWFGGSVVYAAIADGEGLLFEAMRPTMIAFAFALGLGLIGGPVLCLMAAFSVVPPLPWLVVGILWFGGPAFLGMVS